MYCKDAYYSGTAAIIKPDASVSIGDNVMLVLKYTSTYSNKTGTDATAAAGMTLKTLYNPSLITPLADEEKSDAIYDAKDAGSNPVFTRRNADRWGASSAIAPAIDAEGKNSGKWANIRYTRNNNNTYFSLPDGALGFVFFKVNDDENIKGKTITFKLDKSSGNASVISDGSGHSISFDSNDYSIKIAGGSETLSNDTTLSGLSFTGDNGETYVPKEGFIAGGDTHEFNIYVPSTVNSITMDAIANEKGTITASKNKEYKISSYDTLDGKDLSTGNNSKVFNFIVQAENTNSTQTYQVNVYKLSDDTTLSSLSASGINKITTTNYSNITVPYKTTGTTLRASATLHLIVKTGL